MSTNYERIRDALKTGDPRCLAPSDDSINQTAGLDAYVMCGAPATVVRTIIGVPVTLCDACASEMRDLPESPRAADAS